MKEQEHIFKFTMKHSFHMKITIRNKKITQTKNPIVYVTYKVVITHKMLINIKRLYISYK